MASIPRSEEIVKAYEGKVKEWTTQYKVAVTTLDQLEAILNVADKYDYRPKRYITEKESITIWVIFRRYQKTRTRLNPENTH